MEEYINCKGLNNEINYNSKIPVGAEHAYWTLTVLLVCGRYTKSQSHQEHYTNVGLILVLNWII